jgi:hypothetical protein
MGFTMPPASGRAIAAPTLPRTAVLRRCACGGRAPGGGECEECRAKRMGLRRSATPTAAPGFAPPLVHDVLRSPGRPLDAGTRAYMEPRFGHSFAAVRIHADARAAESAASVQAHAYTVGRDVVFGAGMYAPDSADGRRLIAHELAHVVQQSAGGSAAPMARLEVGPADAPEEREAERAAWAVARGGVAELTHAGAGRLARAGETDRPAEAETSTAAPAVHDGAARSSEGQTSFAGLCIRTPFGPGQVRITGCSPEELAQLRILPEDSDQPIVPVNGTWYDADGVWDGRRSDRLSWFKVGDHCDATLTCSRGRLVLDDWCCNAAASLLKGTPRWVTDGHAALRNVPQ